MGPEAANVSRGPRRPAVLVAILVVAGLMIAAFVSLGLWQLQRLSWKQDLIARIEARQAAAPAPAPGPADWPGIDRASAEYRRVTARGTFAHDAETLVQASTELGTGYWVLTPLRTEQGWWLIVNRGFISPELRDPAKRPAPAREVVEVNGLLRLTEPQGRLFQRNDPATGRWYSRDVQALAAARALPGPVAPYFIDAGADAPGAAAGWPRPGLTVLRFSNNHLVYAVTWFALAAMVAGAAGFLLHDERRLRRLSAGDRPLEPHRPD